MPTILITMSQSNGPCVGAPSATLQRYWLIIVRGAEPMENKAPVLRNTR